MWPLSGSQLPLQVMMPVASTSDCEVEASGGLAGLGSQGGGRGPHPVVGGAVRPSCQAGFGRCGVIPVVTVPRCCLVCVEARRDGVCPEKTVPLVMAE
jgi:hypothetical protein